MMRENGKSKSETEDVRAMHLARSSNLAWSWKDVEANRTIVTHGDSVKISWTTRLCAYLLLCESTGLPLPAMIDAKD